MAAGIDLRRVSLDCLSQLAGEDVKDALVYLDAGAGEAFHFMGGLASLLPFGPRSVCSLENASLDDAVMQLNMAINEPVEKLLIITTHLLSDAHRYVLRCLQVHTSVKACTVLTSLSEAAHAEHPDSPLGPDAFHDYKRLLVEDFEDFLHNTNQGHALKASPDSEYADSTRVSKHFSNHGKVLGSNLEDKFVHTEADSELDTEGPLRSPKLRLIVKVKHFPLIICPLMSRLFVFPSNGAMAGAPLAEKMDDYVGIGLPRIDGRTVQHDDDTIPIGGLLLAHFLHHLAGQLSLKFDVFTLGPLSNDVGKRLTKLSGLADVTGRSKKPAGLLLVDRTLDLATPSCHGDTLMDRFFILSSRRTNGNRSLKPRASPGVVNRHPLDIRVPLEEANGHSLPSEELCVLMSSFESRTGAESVVETNDDMDASDCKLASGTFPLLQSLGGSIFDSVKNQESGRFDLLFEKRGKESILTIKKQLQDALRHEKMNLPDRSRTGAISVLEIHALRKQLAQKLVSLVRHADLIQISKAVELAMGTSFNSKWDALCSAEKILLMSVGDSSQSVAFQIRDLVLQSISTENSRTVVGSQAEAPKLFSLRDALTLAIVGYALAGDSFGSSVSEGPFTREEERELKQAVVDAILEGCEQNLGFLEGLEDSLALHKQMQSSKESSTSEIYQTEPAIQNNDQDAEVNFNEGWEAWADEDDAETNRIESADGAYGKMQLLLEVRDRVEDVFKRLHKVSEARRFLQVKDKPLPIDDNGGFTGSPYTQRSLIHRVLSFVFARAHIPGIEHHSSTVGRFLKSGLGRFGLGQAKPKLMDNKIILVFVIGGITSIEVCEAREAQAAYPMADGVDVLLGGTTFLTPDDVFDLVIGSTMCS